MKTFFLTTLLAVSFFFCSSEIPGHKATPKSKSFPPDIIGDTLIQAQTNQMKLSKASLDNTEQFSITSKYVEGATYVIQVGLPIDYSTSTNTYPVYYFTDGDVAFGMIKEIADLLMMAEEIKNIIVVGISYGQGLDNWGKNRVRDLVPASDSILDKAENTGGADNFLKFIQFELFPVINKNYRANPDSSAIGGHSLGGLFNSYILFKQPELFKNYFIGSPALHWSNKIVLNLEKEYFSNHKELNCNVYMYYGSMDFPDIIGVTNELIQMIQIHNYKGLKFVTRIFEGETHFSVPSIAVTNGLKTLYKP
jgi:hypothetical protein